MKTITASKFRTNCLKYVDQVAETGETLVITKNGCPMVELGPTKKKVPDEKRVDSLFGLHRGQIRITGDIISPLYGEWDPEP